MPDVIEVRCVRDDTVWIKFHDGAHGEVDTSLLHYAGSAGRHASGVLHGDAETSKLERRFRRQCGS
jgi:hypothetical protein